MSTRLGAVPPRRRLERTADTTAGPPRSRTLLLSETRRYALLEVGVDTKVTSLSAHYASLKRLTDRMTLGDVRDVLHELYEMYPTRTRLDLNPSYRRVGHVAHGWYLRIKRSCQALESLHAQGLSDTAWPIRRAILEHTLALRWLADVGDEATDVIIRSHGETARRRQEAALDAGWASADWPVWQEVSADALAASGNASESHMLTNMRSRCAKYGRPDDFAGWLIESNNSHPSWETARPYFTPPPVCLLDAPDTGAGPSDLEFCAQRLLRSLVSLGDMLIETNWDVGDIAARLAVARST